MITNEKQIHINSTNDKKINEKFNIKLLLKKVYTRTI